MALGQALAVRQGLGPVVVGGDARLSTPALRATLIESLLAGGCQVVDLGTVSTPLFYFARHQLGLTTGVMITASHNPANYNGFKIILGELPITEEEMACLQAIMEAGVIRHRPGGRPVQTGGQL